MATGSHVSGFQHIVESSLFISIRCKTVVTLQGVDALHLVGSQLEVEDVVVLGDVGGIGGAWDGDGDALQVPT